MAAPEPSRELFLLISSRASVSSSCKSSEPWRNRSPKSWPIERSPTIGRPHRADRFFFDDVGRGRLLELLLADRLVEVRLSACPPGGLGLSFEGVRSVGGL